MIKDTMPISPFAAREVGKLLFEAQGAERYVDARIANALDIDQAPWTSSIGTAKDLVARLLPGWRLRVGYDVTGLFPEATMSNGSIRACESAPNVPLAILRCGWRAAQCAVASEAEPPAKPHGAETSMP